MANTLSTARESSATDTLLTGSKAIQGQDNKGKNKKSIKDERGSSKDIEKENEPPLNDDTIPKQTQGTKLAPSSAESDKENFAGAKKRKRSRSTRIVPLNECNDEVEESESESSDRDSDDDYATHGKKNKVDLSEHIKRGSSRRRHEPEMSEYEKQRLENIKRNQEMLQFLELPTVTTAIMTVSIEDKNDTSLSDQEKPITASIRIRKQRVKSVPKVVQSVRTSNRLRGLPVKSIEVGEDDNVHREESPAVKKTNIKTEHRNEDDASDNEEDAANLMSGDLFFDEETRKKAIRVDGHYKGWLNEGVMKRYGFEKSAQEAWEANGGGAFSFKDLQGLGDSTGGAKSKSSKKPKHDAKMVAKAMFKKNPNAFFYRHNEPGQEQWTGDWTTEEGELFLKVVKEFGCGDKWGLFASHIPHRVGYQCSNYYRQVVLPTGLVFDPNYEYTSRGKPVYCGKYNQRRD
ncbi:hypothetical protein BX616_006523 [Lobosporangium transversale]|uniref:Myb-like domain-containing protein n=1 Tax=Lobosporangium transversale TaxID=64571 RepID=A0A1Y2GPL7_9FUNG|nr:hypothetical protein BCR41DRAFT_385915 [Lobosporangium transversale]KAF9915278.1 hypothetical protein BX616_006523 [Lobosporangium transversale]ORZ18229.1 hypothetical protein BCR41DRAFT_385915 [Lobosporangium transversale]|eukprot:XP_021882024.1 hypothetical protein BCR41DRAFT_385915 [Lobosporangium transversale]